MLRQNLPSTNIEREENSQAALLLGDAADIEALRVAYRAVVTASAHSVFAERVLPGEAKQPAEPLLSAYQAAVAAFANSVFQATGTPAVEVGRLNADAETLLHPIMQPVIPTGQAAVHTVEASDITDKPDTVREDGQEATCEPATPQETEFVFNLKTENIDPANLDTSEILQPVSSNSISSVETGTDEIPAEAETSGTQPNLDAHTVKRRLKVVLRRDRNSYAESECTSEPAQPVTTDQSSFRPAYRNAAVQAEISQPAQFQETVSSTEIPSVSPIVDQAASPEQPVEGCLNALEQAVIEKALAEAVIGPEADTDATVENEIIAPVSAEPVLSDIALAAPVVSEAIQATLPAEESAPETTSLTTESPWQAGGPGVKPANRTVSRPHLSFYAFNEQSAWSIPLKKTALPEPRPALSVEPALKTNLAARPIAAPTLPSIPETVVQTTTTKDPIIPKAVIEEFPPEIAPILDETITADTLEDLPPNPESWLVKMLSRPRLVAGVAGLCILASSVYALLNSWWLNGNLREASGNVAEAVEPIGMLGVQEAEPVRKEHTGGAFPHLEQLQNHPEAGQNQSAPAKPERQGVLIAQARPSERRHAATPSKHLVSIGEPTGRPDPFAPLLSETDGGASFGESAAPTAPAPKKDILSELQYTGFIGDISARDKVAIIKVQDASAGVTRTLIKKVGETFTVDGERMMLQGISRRSLALSMNGRTRSLDISPYVELTASSDVGGSPSQGGQQGGGSGAVSSGRRNPANPPLEEPGQ